MLIVLCGPDRAGKTTIAETLQEYILFDEVYKGRAPKNKWDADTQVIEMVKKIKLKQPYSVLCDRLPYPDDKIYRPVIVGENSVFTGYHEQNIVKLLMQLRVFYVHVTADIPTLKERWAILGDDPYVTLEQNEVIWANYRLFFHNTRLPHVTIDTSKLDPWQASTKTLHSIQQFFQLTTSNYLIKERV